MKKILGSIFVAVLFLASFISAIGPVGENGMDIYIINNTIIVEGYTIIGVQQYNPITGQYTTTPQKFVSSTNNLFVNRLNETINGTVICDPVIVNQNGTNHTYFQNCRVNQDYHKEVAFLNILTNNSNQSQPTITDTATQAKYEQCLTDKAQFSAGLDSCVKDKSTLNDFSANFTKCQSDLTTCTIDKNAAQTSKSTLEKEKEDTKNRQWMYGGAGLVLGLLGTLYWKGHLGGPKAKRPQDQYNVNQAA